MKEGVLRCCAQCGLHCCAEAWMSVTFVYCVETAKERYVECE